MDIIDLQKRSLVIREKYKNWRSKKTGVNGQQNNLLEGL